MSGSTSNDVNASGGLETFYGLQEVGVFLVDGSGNGVFLVKDFFDHKMFVFAFFGFFYVPLNDDVSFFSWGSCS